MPLRLIRIFVRSLRGFRRPRTLHSRIQDMAPMFERKDDLLVLNFLAADKRR